LFTCPIAKGATQPIIEQPSTARNPSDCRLKVLHIEDDEDFAEVIRGGLKPFAYVQSVTRLTNTTAALDAGPLDVIILDWIFPNGDAGSLLEQIFTTQPLTRVMTLTSDGGREHDPRIW
jgi:DNA-binding response OmpR family regulator